jgi:hypothetical protein
MQKNKVPQRKKFVEPTLTKEASFVDLTQGVLSGSGQEPVIVVPT